MEKPIINIMADIGIGPYAWLKEEDDGTPYLGGNIADAYGGFPEEYEVSTLLEQRFADWVMDFERNYDRPDFDWPAFHDKGRLLAQTLLVQLDGKYRVFYVKPFEDPNAGKDRGVELLLSIIPGSAAIRTTAPRHW